MFMEVLVLLMSGCVRRLVFYALPSRVMALCQYTIADILLSLAMLLFTFHFIYS